MDQRLAALLAISLAVFAAGCTGQQGDLGELSDQTQQASQDEIEEARNAVNSSDSSTGQSSTGSAPECPLEQVSMTNVSRSSVSVESNAENSIEVSVSWSYAYRDDVTVNSSISTGSQVIKHSESRDNTILGSVKITALEYDSCSKLHQPS